MVELLKEFYGRGFIPAKSGFRRATQPNSAPAAVGVFTCLERQAFAAVMPFVRSLHASARSRYTIRLLPQVGTRAVLPASHR